MINLRMIALASAFGLLWAALAAANPTSDIFEVSGEVMAGVTDVEVLPSSGRHEEHNHTWDVQEEQLVEGHTTFVVLNAKSEPHIPKEGSVNVTGFVECSHYADVPTSYWFSLPRFGTPWGTAGGNDVYYPTGVDRAGAQCKVGEQIIITPSVYCNETGCGAGQLPMMTSTGRIVPYSSPDGQSGYLEELTFELDEDGVPQEYFAWSVWLLHAWMDDRGEWRNFFAPIPEDSVREMGVQEFDVLWGHAVPQQ